MNIVYENIPAGRRSTSRRYTKLSQGNEPGALVDGNAWFQTQFPNHSATLTHNLRISRFNADFGVECTLKCDVKDL